MIQKRAAIARRMPMIIDVELLDEDVATSISCFCGEQKSPTYDIDVSF
jgi:hypothetical protein